MKILILNGSARGQKGVTGRLLKAMTKGLSEAGAVVKQYEVQDLKISPCNACLTCMHNNPGVCAVKDDMEEIYEELKNSQVLIVATPVYTDNMSAQMKKVIDRCICCLQPFLIQDQSGRFRHPYTWRMPEKFILLSTAGFPEMETFDPIIATFRAQAATFGSKPIAEICIPGSIALQMEPGKLDHHLALLQEAGRLIARTGELQGDILNQLNTPPLSIDQYRPASAKYEAWCKKN